MKLGLKQIGDKICVNAKKHRIKMDYYADKISICSILEQSN